MTDKLALKWLMKYSKGQRGKIITLIFSGIFFSALSVAFAFAIKGVIDGAIDGNSNKILWSAIALGGIVLLQFAFRVILNGLTEHIRGKLEIVYKSHIFSEILDKKFNKINAYHSGELINRLTSDVSVVVDGIVTIVPTLASAVARLVLAVIALIYLDWIFAVAFFVAGVLVFSTMAFFRKKLKSLHKRTQETDGEVRSYMQECIENLLAVKVFSANDKINNDAKELQEKSFDVKMKRKNFEVVGNASYNFIFSAGYLFAVIYGGVKILNGVMGYGTLSAILQLVNNVQVPFASISNIVPKYFSMLASAERLIEIENIEVENQDDLINPQETYKKLQSINVEGLTFKYDRDTVIENSSIRINKGDFIAITGLSGIGKSTLIKLMLGVYSEFGGEMYLQLEEEKLSLDYKTRPLFSYVPQGNMIFSGTVKENVQFISGEVSNEKLMHALTLSCSKEFIDELPLGLDTKLGEKGQGLSEGQIQRLAIARAVLSDAPVMLLDEATSALDEQTEKKVLENLKKEKDKTLIIISHKKAALEICNRQLEIKDKHIKEI